MPIDLTGRTALVTGSSLGLGLATTLSMAPCGARVAIVARGRGALERARQVLPERAGCHVLGNLLEVSDEMWQHDLPHKLKARVRQTRLSGPDQVRRHWGRLINTLNTLSKAAIAGSAPTALTRAAQRALSKVLSKEGAPHNVRVNALRVAISDPIDRLQADASGRQQLDTCTRKHSAGARVTLGRIGEAPGLTNVACILASDAASCVTGTAINVDAGLCPLI